MQCAEGEKVKEGKEEAMRWTDRGCDPALNQYNHSPYQTFNLKGARTDGGWGAAGKRGRQQGGKERKEKESFGCIQTAITASHLLLHPFIGFNELPGYYVCGSLKATSREEIPGDRRASSYHTQHKQRHLDPEGPTH